MASSKVAESLLCFLRREDAVTSVEYAVILALILVAILGSIGAFGQQTGTMWNGIEGKLEDYGFGAS